jgi:hypothetical protein
MQPIKWNGTTEGNAGTNSSPSSDWYNYTPQTGAIDGKTSNWANVKLEDNSYFVWIPRYAYKIIYFDSEEHANDYRTNGLTSTNEAWIQGYSTVYGILDKDKKVIAGTNPNIDYKVKTAGYTDYIPHPAFLGTGYEDLGGGFGTNNKGIEGFWVAKFTMSMETNGTATTPSSTSTGNIATSSSVKAVSKPNVSTWRYINVANMYTNSRNYDSTKDSHLIKNSEWGAVAYLTHSKYGRNGTEVRINNNSEYYTGWGATTHDTNYVSYNASSTDNLWTGQYGLLASTTGNITGIYDMNGGTCQHTSVFNKAYSGTYFTEASYLNAGGTHFASTGGSSTKYETAYYNNATGYTINKFIDYYINGKNASRIGDGLVEVFVENSTAWNDDYTDIVYLDWPFLYRGGNCYDGELAGMFLSCSGDRLSVQQRWFPCGVCILTLIFNT